jgi:4-hydroxy-tetrahydrodipicolinate reductase
VERTQTKIAVLLAGCCGQMGQEVTRALAKESDLQLAAAVDPNRQGEDVGIIAGIGAIGVAVEGNLESALAHSHPDVLCDFTTPAAVMDDIRTALQRRVACVVGTTGLGEDDLLEIAGLCDQQQAPCLVAPNFAIGAVLMMQFAAAAARHLPHVEIIELHHDRKRDAPSGTSQLTAKLINDAVQLAPAGPGESPARGEAHGGVRIHSVRLPGLVAHQEVIFGGLGQTLGIRHDSLSRESFMPGVLLAIRKVRSLTGLTYGLGKIL